MSPLKTAIKSLHARKDLAYGGSWKRRGERISVVPNIARKVDRLAAFQTNQSLLRDEHLLDTAIDLYVYSTKYILFLAEQYQQLEKHLTYVSPTRPLTDIHDNFDQLIDIGKCDEPHGGDITLLIAKISDVFENLWQGVEKGVQPERRFALAEQLSQISAQLVARLNADQPEIAALFIRRELE